MQGELMCFRYLIRVTEGSHHLLSCFVILQQLQQVDPS